MPPKKTIRSQLAWLTALAAVGAEFAWRGGAAGMLPGDGPPGFTIRSWQTEQGLPQNTVNAILHPSDGYLWLGTQNGLVRFDGVRFTTFGLQDGLQSVQVRALLEDRDGVLWVGTAGGGVSRLREGRLETFTRLRGLAGDVVNALALDGEGKVWIGTALGLSLWRQGRFATAGGADGLPAGAIRYLHTDRRGSLWVATGQDGLWRRQGSKFEKVPVPFPDDRQPVAYCLLEDRRGRLWVSVGNGVLLGREGGAWQRYDATHGLPLAYVTSLAEGADGTIWAGTLDEGLFRLVGAQFQPITQRDGLSDNAVRSILDDGEGDLWVGTRAGGLNRLTPRKLVTFTAAQGLTNEFVRSLTESSDGTLWVATTGGGLYRGHDGAFTNFVPAAAAEEYRFAESVITTRDGALWWGGAQGLFSLQPPDVLRAYTGDSVPWLRGDTIQCLCEDRAGGVWVGTARGQLRLLRNEQFTDTLEIPSAGPLTALAQSPDGTVWVGTGGAGVLRIKGQQVTSYGPQEGLLSGLVRALYLDPQGVLWIGTVGGGLSRLADEKISSFTIKDGLVDDTISQILEDDAANLWLGSNRGISRVGKWELNELSERRIAYVHPLVFGKSEGLPSEECAGGASPNCLKSKSGLLYFATVKGVAAVDPKRVKLNTRPPVVVLESAWLDGEVQTLSVRREPAAAAPSAPGLPEPEPRVVIPAGTRNVEFHYTGLSFAAPDRVRFRFRLEGLDPDWIEAGTRRVAYYTHIPSGDYQFRVIACNADGVWNQTGAAVGVTVRPFFYQTWWFILIESLSLAAALGLGVRSVTRRRLQRRLELLEMQTAVEQERTRIARDIHDDLGASLTQITLLSELGRTSAAQPQQAEQHFERIASKARSVVQALDEIVWAVNPKNDNLPRLVEYICRFADECVESTPMRCWQEVPENLPSLPVRAEVRHNFFLAVKEAFHNVLKHSQATELWLRITLAGPELRLSVEDNGVGFSLAQADFSRSGLKNMKTRIGDIGGQMDLRAAPGEGTRVTFTIRLSRKGRMENEK